MDALMYIQMVKDKHVFDLEAMSHKYSKQDVAEMVRLLEISAFQPLALPDFSGERDLVYAEMMLRSAKDAAKTLMSYRGTADYGPKALEEEIISTLMIEQIDTSRDSVRKILGGSAPRNQEEHRIWGMKQGFEFIADRKNRITEENMRKLYELAINPYLEEPEDRLKEDQLYRDDVVFVVNSLREKAVHKGLPAALLRERMGRLFEFIETEHKMDDLLKASAVHFYLAYLHPYFDGNGRMARMVHLWYLLQKGYSSALFLPFSSLIQRTKAKYYKAYSLVEANAKISGVVDITPFLDYINGNVYSQIGQQTLVSTVMEEFAEYMSRGEITRKEKDLFNFVVFQYGTEEFSTKQLEKDFGDCAYATIRTFVLKFAEKGLLEVHPYKNRTRYCLTAPDEAKGS